jgi:hypothetical protein
MHAPAVGAAVVASVRLDLSHQIVLGSDQGVAPAGDAHVILLASSSVANIRIIV